MKSEANEGLVLGLSLLVGCAAPSPSELTTKALSTAVDVPVRVFSTSPSLGATATSTTDPNDPRYGALQVFFDKARRYTDGGVAFTIAAWQPTAPNSVLRQVGIDGDPDVAGVARDAAYDNGGALNPVWGFVYNSVPFGLSFDLMVEFLYAHGGLALAQSLLDARGLNVKVLPVVGSNPQGSGFFRRPIGKAFCNGERDCKAERPIGLEGLCQAGWTFRYLPPAQHVLDRACEQLVADGIIPGKRITFVASVPGQTILGAVQSGAITAFEFASALDDYDPPPSGCGFFPALPEAPIPQTAQNPGHKGLRFYHSPQWHQPFYMGWLMLNRSSVWDALAPEQRIALEQAAHDALVESYAKSGSVQCEALRRMFDHNDGQVQLDTAGNPLLVDGKTVSADLKWAEWPKDALDRLQAASTAHLDALRGGAAPTPDQAEYATVIDALRSYIDDIHYAWKPNQHEYPTQCPQPMPR